MKPTNTGWLLLTVLASGLDLSLILCYLEYIFIIEYSSSTKFIEMSTLHRH